MKNAMMRLGPSSTGEVGKPTGSPKAPARASSSSSSISSSKQATARQVAAELIRRGEICLSAPFHSAPGSQDNLLPLQVLDGGAADKQQYLPAFTEEQRARLQKSRAERDERVALLKAKGSSASTEHALASGHALWNTQNQRELKEAQEKSEGPTNGVIMDNAKSAVLKCWSY